MEHYIQQERKIYSYQDDQPSSLPTYCQYIHRAFYGFVKRLLLLPFLLLIGIYLILFVNSCKYPAFTAMMWDMAGLFWQKEGRYE